MAKGRNQKPRQNGSEPSPHAVPNRDLMLRMNFLYQVAAHLTCLPEDSRSSQETTRNEEKQQNVAPGTYQDLARVHVRTMRQIGKKSMVKMDPSVKRTLCRVCSSVLIPGITSRMRVKSSKVHRHVISQTCSSCGEVRHIPAPPQPKPSNEKTPVHPIGDDQQVSKIGTEYSFQDVEDSLTMTEGRSGPQSEGSFCRNPPLFESDKHVVYRGSERLQ